MRLLEEGKIGNRGVVLGWDEGTSVLVLEIISQVRLGKVSYCFSLLY